MVQQSGQSHAVSSLLSEAIRPLGGESSDSNVNSQIVDCELRCPEATNKECLARNHILYKISQETE